MRKSDIFFSVLTVPLDYLMLIAAGLLSYLVRYHPLVTELRPVVFNLSFSAYTVSVLAIGIAWIAVFSLSGLYKIPEPRRFIDVIGRIIFASTAGFLIITVWMFIQRELFDSRFIILAAWVIAILLLILERWIIRVLRQSAYRRSHGLEQSLLIGNNGTAEKFEQTIHNNKNWGLKSEGTIELNTHTPEILVQKLKHPAIDSVIVTDANAPRELIEELMVVTHDSHKKFYYAADIFDAHLRNIDIITVLGTPLIHIKRTPLDGWGRIIKRSFDVIFSTVLLVLMSPIFALIALAIKLTSNGPVFVGLTRIGSKGKEFTLYKFRSMVDNAHEMKKELLEENERSGPLFKMQNDPRVTKVGKFLRAYSLDEFPQFWNVLKGDMSVVGPRPHEPEEVSQYKHHQKRVLSINPGVSGMAQISGRSSLAFAEEIRLDMYYIENWSLKMDIGIILKTPLVVLSRKNAS